jgi:hypothetical protein
MRPVTARKSAIVTIGSSLARIEIPFRPGLNWPSSPRQNSRISCQATSLCSGAGVLARTKRTRSTSRPPDPRATSAKTRSSSCSRSAPRPRLGTRSAVALIATLSPFLPRELRAKARAGSASLRAPRFRRLRRARERRDRMKPTPARDVRAPATSLRAPDADAQRPVKLGIELVDGG